MKVQGSACFVTAFIVEMCNSTSGETVRMRPVEKCRLDLIDLLKTSWVSLTPPAKEVSLELQGHLAAQGRLEGITTKCGDPVKDASAKRFLGLSLGGENDADMSLAALGLEPIDIWQAACQAFETATRSVDAQITDLQGALRNSDDLELQDIAEFGLSGFTGDTRVPLLAALHEASGERGHAGRCGGDFSDNAGDRRVGSQIRGEPRIAACDNNPFGVNVSIRDTYDGALEQLETAAKAA